MTKRRKFAIASYLLRRWYWALALGLSVIIWGVFALAMRPLPDANGKFQIKTIAGGRKLRYRGRQRNRAWFRLTTAVYNLIRITALDTQLA